ncbi:GNAT family N-acetyltransferase [Streptosporangium saharense]|uniref:GNAT family N-acetyltransferase n=1 Tax=Streptosporangium saharense TaxID=1706840 RepID=UPI00332D419F
MRRGDLRANSRITRSASVRARSRRGRGRHGVSERDPESHPLGLAVRRRQGESAGLGRRIMAGTLRAAWDAGCYKAMLMTGSRDPATHAFYRACGFSPDSKTAYLARP